MNMQVIINIDQCIEAASTICDFMKNVAEISRISKSVLYN